ncbi:unnamed protein product [Prorocentrum cordatum]|uniref:Uncharacterized protein n=1 Tax=Prorocentrum cordatum TaxID=2364126 RepID=A0ABN9U9N1_9DINO|nr:unnamed protein product [Polarella glacialis]
MVLNGVQTAVTGAQVAAVAAAETAQAAALAVKQMDERYQISSMLSRISGSPAALGASPVSKLGGVPSPSPVRALAAERKDAGSTEKRRPPPQRQPPPPVVPPASKSFEAAMSKPTREGLARALQLLPKQMVLSGELMAWHTGGSKKVKGLPEYALGSGWWKVLKSAMDVHVGLQFDLSDWEVAVAMVIGPRFSQMKVCEEAKKILDFVAGWRRHIRTPRVKTI